MPTKKLTVKLSPIAKEIDKAIEELEDIRSSVSPKALKKLNLEIKGLRKARKSVAAFCRSMTSIFPG